jgi:hypothetical protein
MEGILWTLKVEPKGTHPLAIGHKKPGGWVPLFDGKTLDFGAEWETSGDPAVTRKHWTVQPGGILQGDSRNLPGTESSHLYYIQKKFKNFEYKADVNINRDGNSGMYFRCVDRNRNEKGIWQDWPNGYEAQVNLGSPHDPKRSGTFYGWEEGTLYDKDIQKYLGYDKDKPGDDFWWNQHIIAVGNHFVVKLNGQVVVDLYDKGARRAARRAEGFFAFQMHHRGAVVKFKNIQVRELP